MIRMFYNRVYDDRYIMFHPTKIKNRIVKGTFYIERDFKKVFPSYEPYYFMFDYSKHLDLKQLKVETI